MSLDRFPSELKKLRQWVVAGKNKIPINPNTGDAADVTDPETWGWLEEAQRHGTDVGFVLSSKDPYSFIDLDKPITDEQVQRHRKILSLFNSYTEVSVSGKGLHIIVRGTIPKGVRRDNVEVYSQDRYMICTGNVFHATPILEHGELLNKLYAEMSSTQDGALLEEVEETLTDQEVHDMASSAVNGPKYDLLCCGRWEGMYPSQSEADLALITILAFYTRSNAQVRRMFRHSALGRREKAQRDAYIDYALEKVRSKQTPLVDLTKLQKAVATQPVPTIEEKPPEVKDKELLDPLPVFPEGLLGELAQYIYSSSIRPVEEISLAAAIALMAGVCGRSYNISGMGLNQYVILLANTGCGKEGAAKGIDSIITAARSRIPMADDFIGPSAFASGQALIKTLDNKPSFVSLMGEFGLTLQQLCDPKAMSPLVMLKRVLLDLYAKSGYASILRPSVYSDSEKNTKMVRSPNVTILGESTPETFYGKLSQMHIAEGLIPRFLVLEYLGPRTKKNEHAFHPPQQELIERVCQLITVALSAQQNNGVCDVEMDDQAQNLMDTFDKMCDRHINDTEQDVERQLWNRAHLKALKLSALVAVGVNPHRPIIDAKCARWALRLVRQDVKNMSRRFSQQSVGEGEHVFEAHIRHIVDSFMSSTPEQRKSYGVNVNLLDKSIVPFAFIRRRARRVAAFQNDRRGIATALKVCLVDLIEAGVLERLPPEQAQEFGRRDAQLFVRGENW